VVVFEVVEFQRNHFILKLNGSSIVLLFKYFVVFREEIVNNYVNVLRQISKHENDLL
jgi:hypothetical protein